MAVDFLSDRALNRATLERQLLLDRRPLAPMDAVDHLVGLQAQNPLDPYLALWSRVEGFDPAALGVLMEDRSLVRIVVMRGTIHLVTAADALALRPLMQPVLDAEIARHSEFAPLLVDVDLAPVMAVARSVLASRPRRAMELRAVLEERFPMLHPGALAYAARCLLPLVQVPPRGVWGKAGQVTLTPLDAWVSSRASSAALPTIDDVVLRYFGAFGPATVADVARWSRLMAMREVIDRLRPRLRVFRDSHDRELFDLPTAPRPDADTPAPVRLLPQYDNLLLSHADRTRFGSDDDRRFDGAIGPPKGTVLVDGQVRAMWHSEHEKRPKRSTIVVEHLPLPRRSVGEVEAEAWRAVRFWHPTADEHDVRLRTW